MKKVLLFAVALCYLMSAPAQPIKNEPKAQKTWKTTFQQVKKLNRHENSFTTKLDSVTADWIKYAYDYDARCNCVRKTEYDFDNEYGWFASCVWDYSYDALDRLTSTLSSTNVSMDKKEYLYNEQGFVSAEISSGYTDHWYYRYKYKYGYDGEGNMVTSIKYNHNGNDWFETEKRVWEYEEGRLLSLLYSQFDEAQWVPYEKTDYNYNEQGFCNELIISSYMMGGEWDVYYKELYEYDEAGNLLSKIKIRKNYITNEMVYRAKFEFEYDGNNNCTAAHLYDYESGNWYFEGGYEFIYDSNISIDNVAGLPAFWEELMDELDTPIPLYTKLQYVIIHDEDNYTYQVECHYSSYDAINEQAENNLSLWPNPATKTLSLNAEGLQQVEIFSMDGKQVMHVKNNLETIHVDALAKGCYLLKATFSDGNKAMRKFVKE